MTATIIFFQKKDIINLRNKKMNEKIKFFIEKIKHNILEGRYDITDYCGDCFVDEKEIQSCMKDCGDIPEECYICNEMFEYTKEDWENFFNLLMEKIK